MDRRQKFLNAMGKIKKRYGGDAARASANPVVVAFTVWLVASYDAWPRRVPRPSGVGLRKLPPAS
jgi:hypothetical protein